MIERLKQPLAAIHRAIERHGGGGRGLAAVVRRSLKVVRALGLHGFLQRVRMASHSPASVVPPPGEHHFPAPVPVDRLQLKVGMMAHVFYADLIEEFAVALGNMPVPYVLMVSVMDEDARQQAHARFSQLPGLQDLHVRVVPNRGRDIAPLLVTFRDEVLALEVIGHIHTKKSLYTGTEQGQWRRYLLNSLLGAHERIAWQLGMFQAEPKLGMIYPESYHGVPLWAHTWLSNAAVCRELGQRLGIGIDASSYIDFPAGSMFWARVDGLRALYDLNLTLEDFPEERGEIDGTLHHAVERMLVAVVRHQRQWVGILPADGTLALSSEGARNWAQGFDTPLATRLTLSSLEAELVSLDIFDTLVVRPFLTPTGARAYLSHLAERRHGVSAFADLRERAETKARSLAGHDVTLADIYRAMATLPGAESAPLTSLQSLETELEARLLRPRQGVVEAVGVLRARGKRLVALSDMYMDTAMLRRVLPVTVSELPQAWYVSCETRWRKDDDSAWQQLPSREHVSPAHWLHVGDNEHADIQRPQMHRLLTPVHVLRPAALLEVVPALRPLRPAQGAATAWQDQLWLGLVANHLADLVDRQPQRMLPAPQLSPSSFGYVVLGPLLFDYVAWLTRLARERGVAAVLFLAREGHLLNQVFQLLREACPSLASLQGLYLLTSRRGSGTPTLRSLDDLVLLLDSTFVGSLQDLLRARLGEAATSAAEAVLGASCMKRDVYLPEMRTEIAQLLEPAADALLKVASTERHNYLRYWRATVGDQPAMVADIGYSGSIQANLSRLTDTPLGGGYFALNGRATKIEGRNWAEARYFDGRVQKDGIASVILEHDLLLESLLTAPNAQFSHFEIDQDQPIAIYAQPESAPSQWATIAQVHQGVLAFVTDLLAVTGAESDQLDLDRDLLQVPLHCVGSGRWQAPWLSEIAVSDTFTGRGSVSSA